MKSIVYGILTPVKLLLAWLLIIPVLPFLSVFFMLKLGVILWAKIVHPQLKALSGNEIVSAVDKIALNDHVKYDYERTPLNNVSIFFKLREPRTQLDMKEIERRFQENIDKNTDFGWRLKSYLVRFCGYSFFQEVPKFNVSAHIRKVNLDPKERVHDYLNSWILEQYPHQSPLWELLVLESGLECFLAFKMHHIVGDGISGAQILNDVFGFKQHPELQKYINSAPRRYSVSEVIFLIVSCPALTLEIVFKAFLATDTFKIKTGIPVDQYMSTSTLNLVDVKAIGKMQGVSFNSVLLTIYSGAIQRLLRNKMQKLPTDFMIPVPQPWSGRPKNYIGNQFGVITPHVPLNITDPLQLLHEIHNRTTHMYKSGHFSVVNHVFFNIMTTFPLWLQIFMMNTCTSGTTALSPMLAGEYSMYDGNEAESAYILTGITAPNFGLKTMTLSFNTMLAWTVVGSREVFKNQEELDLFTKIYIQASFEELLSAVNRSKSPIRSAEQIQMESQKHEVSSWKKAL